MIPYEVIEHTAEIGIRAYGRSSEELFVHMAQGMLSLIVPPEQVHPRQTRRVKAAAEDWDHLLVAWLRELLFLFDTKHFLGSSIQITKLTPTAVEAEVSGERLDPKRHEADKEVKAVTYCDLKIFQTAEGIWTAEVIFDV